jgi:Flp pilus assembly pilin Flp
MLDKLVVKLMVFKMRLSDERGQDVMEYAILTGGIAVVLVLALVFFTGGITGFFTRLGTFMGTLVPNPAP